jgi:hypothetical protein
VRAARLMRPCAAPHLEDARHRLGLDRAARGHGGAERRQHGHLIGIAVPAAQQATVFELLCLAPELDDARDLDDFVYTAFSNGCFYGILEWKLPADVSVRTAEIGGRSRQAQHDHQGRVGSQLACGTQLQEGDLQAFSLHVVSLHVAGRLWKAVAERHGEKVRREDDLREVAKSAVRADMPSVAMLPEAATVGVSLHRQKSEV